MKVHLEEKPKAIPGMVWSVRQGSFINKSGISHVPSSNSDYFKGLLFRIGKDGPNLYKKTIDCLAQYASTQFKTGSDVVFAYDQKNM